MAAMALITDPEVVILDEPTTALDVTTQVEVLRAFRRVVRERQVTAVYVCHDLAVVAQMADHILVLRDGAMRETRPSGPLTAPAEQLHEEPARRSRRPAARAIRSKAADSRSSLLEVRGLTAGYGPIDRQGRPPMTILRDIDLEIRAGSALGVIGESGSGKTHAGARHRRAAAAAAGTMSSTAWRCADVGGARPGGAAAHPDRLPVGRHGAQPRAHRRAHPGAAARLLSPGLTARRAAAPGATSCSTW